MYAFTTIVLVEANKPAIPSRHYAEYFEEIQNEGKQWVKSAFSHFWML